MAVVIDFSGLVTTRRQPQPCADRTRCSEVRWILNRRDIRYRSDGADARDRHEQLNCLALPRDCEKLSVKIDNMLADVAPRLEQRQYDHCQPVLPVQELPDIAMKYGAFA